MSKASGTGSLGGRRGGVVTSTMSVSEAKSISKKKTGGKPALGTKVSNSKKKTK